MSIYDIDYTQQANNLVNPGKRKPKILAILNALVYPIQWLRDIFFVEYVMGSTSPTYNSGSTYLKLDKVVGKDKAVYQALQAVPTSTDPSVSANSLYWQKISDNFIGTEQRALSTSQIIILQGDASTDPAVNLSFSISGRANQNGLLNKWFGITAAPWIYIRNNDVLLFDTFLWGVDPLASSSFSRTDDPLAVNAYMPLTYSGPGSAQYDFTIMFPTAAYNALGAQKEKIVRRFVNQYVVAGIIYNIENYG